MKVTQTGDFNAMTVRRKQGKTGVLLPLNYHPFSSILISHILLQNPDIFQSFYTKHSLGFIFPDRKRIESICVACCNMK